MADGAEGHAKDNRSLDAGDGGVLPLHNLREFPMELSLCDSVIGKHTPRQGINVAHILNLVPEAPAEPGPERPHAHTEAGRGVEDEEGLQVFGVRLREDVVRNPQPLREPRVGPVHAQIAIHEDVRPVHGEAIHLQQEESESTVQLICIVDHRGQKLGAEDDKPLAVGVEAAVHQQLRVPLLGECALHGPVTHIQPGLGEDLLVLLFAGDGGGRTGRRRRCGILARVDVLQDQV
mmetsp:Transcript_107411/g.331852  ORF Transcript_107411/g.331852 Transcript_107411/m.331852 type:complete len:234 (+) Transcript_107411:689-1390(+)